MKHLLPKLTRQPSHSAPPPRLVAPQLPEVRSPESERDDETAGSTDYETDEYENSSEYHCLRRGILLLVVVRRGRGGRRKEGITLSLT